MNIVAAALLSVLVSGAADDRVFWIFLVKGPHRDQAPPELEKGQAGHLENLGRLAVRGDLLLAGPLTDDGVIRGTGLLRAASLSQVRKDFEPDPFVTMGRLAIQAQRFEGDTSVLGKAATPIDMIQTTLAIGRKGDAWQPTTVTSEEHRQSLARWAKDEGLALSGRLMGDGDRVEVLLFRSADAAKVRQLLATDPAVASSQLTYELHPQLLARGVLKDPAR